MFWNIYRWIIKTICTVETIRFLSTILLCKFPSNSLSFVHICLMLVSSGLVETSLILSHNSGVDFSLLGKTSYRRSVFLLLEEMLNDSLLSTVGLYSLLDIKKEFLGHLCCNVNAI